MLGAFVVNRSIHCVPACDWSVYRCLFILPFLQVLGGVGLEWQLSHIFTSFKKEVNLDGGNTRGIPPAPDIIYLRVGTHRAF